MQALPVRRSAGFTLLELMVVLVLIGIIFSFAVLSISGDDYANLMEEETHRMMTLLELASDEAILRGEELAVLFSEDGYQFLMLREDLWLATENDGLLKAYSLPEGVELRLEVEGEPPILTAASEDETIETVTGPDGEELEVYQPQVFILSSGEMTPFTVTFMAPRQSPVRYHMTASILGALSWEREETL